MARMLIFSTLPEHTACGGLCPGENHKIDSCIYEALASVVTMIRVALLVATHQVHQNVLAMLNDNSKVERTHRYSFLLRLRKLARGL